MQKALANLQAVKASPAKQVLDVMMDEIVRLTASQLGYIAVMNDTEDELTMVGWSKSAMAMCKVMDKPIVYAITDTGLWGDCVRERKPVITNDYKALVKATKKGYPAGHVEVVRHMNIPVYEGKLIVAVAGIGNKATDYGQADVDALTQFMNEAWKILRNKI